MKNPSLDSDHLNGLDLSSTHSKKLHLKALYSSYFKVHPVKTALLSLLTFGLYLRFLRKNIKKQFYNELSLKKICLYPELEARIEKIRQKVTYINPKAGIQSVYKEITQSEELGQINKLYSKSELLLFISSPIEDEQILKTFQNTSSSRNHYRDWQYMKQSSRQDEIQNIRKINHCYSLLKNRYLLTKGEVNQRLTRTSLCQKNLTNLTLLKVVRTGFEEILSSFEIYSSLKKTNHPLYEIFSMLMNVHKEEISEIISHLAGEKTLFELSLASKRFLLDFSSKIGKLQTLPLEDLKNSPCLIFSENQENLFKKLLDSIELLNDKVDELLTGYYDQAAPTKKLYEKLRSEAKILTGSEKAGLFFKNKPTDSPLLLTENFFQEGQSFDCFIELVSNGNQKEIHSIEELYDELHTFCENDENLFMILQELSSSAGRNFLANSIREGLSEQLGKNSLIENLKIAKISIHKVDPDKLEISYKLSHDLNNNKKELQQSFVKCEDQWQLQ